MPPKSVRLAAPLKKFIIPVVSWRPDELQFREFQATSRITYAVPLPIKIMGREWRRVAAYDANNDLLGEFILPVRYLSLWRRLIYGALLHEKMFEAWIRRTKRLKGRSLNAVEEEEINLRNMAGVRLVQYLLCRRLVLEELMKLRFEDHEPVVHSLIEFGIRESRDWLFETYSNAKKEGGNYLRLDPTSPLNKKEFAKGYNEGLEILSPPKDDDWWDGDFTHFDFDSTFKELAKSVPKTMADKGFKSVKWTIETTSPDMPVEWNDTNITFFSHFFIQFLRVYAKDPRDAPEAYFRKYFEEADAEDIKAEISGELLAVLGDRFDKERVKELGESFDIEAFFHVLGFTDTPANETQGQALRHDVPTDLLALPEGAEEILLAFCQPNTSGFGLPEAQEQLVRIFGPGSEAVASKLLDDLAADPFGGSRLGWDVAVAEALRQLKELKRGQLGSPPDVEMDKETGTSAQKGPTTEGEELGDKGDPKGKGNASSSHPDDEMDEEPGTSKQGTAEGEGGAVEAMYDYMIKSSQLLS